MKFNIIVAKSKNDIIGNKNRLENRLLTNIGNVEKCKEIFGCHRMF